jgi:hypothetical protein
MVCGSLGFVSGVNHVDGFLNGSMKTANFSQAGAGQRECRAVIYGSTNDGQAECDIHSFAKAGVFKYRQALIMVHGEHGISASEQAWRE